MFLGELEELGRVPANSVLCLLCRQRIVICDGDLTTFQEHLELAHSVLYNARWIIDCTFRSQDRTGLLRDSDSRDESTDEFIESNRRKRGRRRSNRAKRSKKTFIAQDEDGDEEEVMEDEKEVPLSASIKRCDVKLKIKDYSLYLKDLGIETLGSPNTFPDVEEFSESSVKNAIVTGDTECSDKLEENLVGGHEITERERPEEVEVDNENEMSWFVGSTFTCLECNYQSKLCSQFEDHVEKEHNSHLRLFSKRYKVSSVKYSCKICASKVRHDKLSIESHVQSHFLSLAKYGQLYERKRLKEKALPSNPFSATTDRVETEASVSTDIVNITVEESIKDPTQKQILELDTEEKLPCDTAKTSTESDFIETELMTPEVVGDENQIGFTIAEVNEVINNLLSEEAEKSMPLVTLPCQPTPPQSLPSISNTDDVYVYCCPFQGCHYTFNFQASVDYYLYLSNQVII